MQYPNFLTHVQPDLDDPIREIEATSIAFENDVRQLQEIFRHLNDPDGAKNCIDDDQYSNATKFYWSIVHKCYPDIYYTAKTICPDFEHIANHLDQSLAVFRLCRSVPELFSYKMEGYQNCRGLCAVMEHLNILVRQGKMKGPDSFAFLEAGIYLREWGDAISGSDSYADHLWPTSEDIGLPIRLQWLEQQILIIPILKEAMAKIWEGK